MNRYQAGYDAQCGEPPHRRWHAFSHGADQLLKVGERGMVIFYGLPRRGRRALPVRHWDRAMNGVHDVAKDDAHQWRQRQQRCKACARAPHPAL